MLISLNYSELLFDIKNKNRSEVASLEPSVRYRAEVGSDKKDEINRCLRTALSTLTTTYVRFITEAFTLSVENTVEDIDVIKINLYGSDRRFDGKVEAIADALHSILVNLTLSQFYVSVGQPELSGMRANLATADIQILKKLLYSKQPPCVC